MRASTKIRYLNRMQKYRKHKRKWPARRRQRGGFLNRYDFAYGGSDTINTVMKGLDNLAPKLISQISEEIDKIAEARIRQAIAPQIIYGAIEEVYKTPFRLLGNFGKQKFNQLKRKIFKLITK